MTNFDDGGYIANGPVKPDRWRQEVPEMPDGVIITRRSVPPGVLLIQNFLEAELCDAIVRECEQQQGVDHTVSAPGDSLTTSRGPGRVSEYIDVRNLKTDIIGVMRDTFAGVVAPHYQKEIDWFELPEILRYKTGGEYRPHADAENWFAEEKKWKRVIDRDLSILIYLNEGYQGGEIVFPNFGFGFPPKRGLMIAFPSDCRFVHNANPVRSGVRYALVGWAATKGSPRVGDGPRENAIKM